MVKLVGTFSRLGPCRVMVIGDFVVDRYTLGKAQRISPEAPVAVIQVKEEEDRPGMAGNVVLNLLSLGAQVVAVGRLGSNAAGSFVRQCLEEEGVDGRGLFVQSDYVTPVKNRIIADHQQIVRVDYEKIMPLPAGEERRAIEISKKLLEEVDIVAISDYGKGCLSDALLREVIQGAIQRGKPVITDPKGTEFWKYRQSTIIKPNLSEAVAASGLGTGASLDAVAAALHAKVPMEYLMVTRSEAGIAIYPKEGARLDFPARSREVKDSTGAGDTVLAMLTCALANGLSVGEAAQLSNVAAGLAIERLGCARISLQDLAERLLELDSANKIITQDHFFALKEALKGSPCALVVADSRGGFTTDLFRELQECVRRGEKAVVWMRDADPEEAFVSLMASLKEVAFLIVHSQQVEPWVKCLMPRRVVEMGSRVLT